MFKSTRLKLKPGERIWSVIRLCNGQIHWYPCSYYTQFNQGNPIFEVPYLAVRTVIIHIEIKVFSQISEYLRGMPIMQSHLEWLCVDQSLLSFPTVHWPWFGLCCPRCILQWPVNYYHPVPLLLLPFLPQKTINTNPHHVCQTQIIPDLYRVAQSSFTVH